MSGTPIGILHPGAMGSSVAASACNTGREVCWLAAGRSPETAARAARHDLTRLATLQEFCAVCDPIISVCPPGFAGTVAEQVLSAGFRGIYLDANAISPQHTREIASTMTRHGVDYVDGGIIGPPAWQAGTTVLYLSGARAQELAACFAEPLEVRVIGVEPGPASALKMCFAANNKGTTALLGAVLAAAETLGVRAELERFWSRNASTYAAQNAARVSRNAVKAWRFTDEMREIESTFMEAGLPGGFHAAAAEIYRRQAGFRGADSDPALGSVLDALLSPGDSR